LAEPRSKPSSPRRVDVHEFRSSLTFFLQQVQDGYRFALTSHDNVVAEIGPPSSGVTIRKPGALRGKIKVSEDFDALPTGVLQVLEDGA
jgi:antitoxin (DNA-binding transcriptional repressor) of toxin-antitoxin stability system